MNENKKPTVKKTKKIKPNIIDFIILIAIIGAIIGIAIRSGVVEKVTINNSLESARVTFLISGVSESTGECFDNGDVFYSSTHGCTFGTLEQFWPNPAEIYAADEFGALKKVYLAEEFGMIDIDGTMICTGVFTADGFFLGGSHFIAPNSPVTVKSADVEVNILIMDIEKVDAAQ